VPSDQKAFFDSPLVPDFSLEKKRWQRGERFIGGVDEAGRGALAGPVFAAVVVFPDQPGLEEQLKGVNDSKQLSPKSRDLWEPRICKLASMWAVGKAGPGEIDRLGIAEATRLAIRRAILELKTLPDHLLVDYIRLPNTPIPQTSLPKGDCRSLSIAAASILAKTARDRHMKDLAGRFPGYDWQKNKGYGTAAHLKAIRELGPCVEHRFTFAPMKQPDKETNHAISLFPET